jgi:hypothetical protein
MCVGGCMCGCGCDVVVYVVWVEKGSHGEFRVVIPF